MLELGRFSPERMLRFLPDILIHWPYYSFLTHLLISLLHFSLCYYYPKVMQSDAVEIPQRQYLSDTLLPVGLGLLSRKICNWKEISRIIKIVLWVLTVGVGPNRPFSHIYKVTEMSQWLHQHVHSNKVSLSSSSQIYFSCLHPAPTKSSQYMPESSQGMSHLAHTSVIQVPTQLNTFHT